MTLYVSKLTDLLFAPFYLLTLFPFEVNDLYLKLLHVRDDFFFQLTSNIMKRNYMILKGSS